MNALLVIWYRIISCGWTIIDREVFIFYIHAICTHKYKCLYEYIFGWWYKMIWLRSSMGTELEAVFVHPGPGTRKKYNFLKKKEEQCAKTNNRKMSESVEMNHWVISLRGSRGHHCSASCRLVDGRTVKDTGLLLLPDHCYIKLNVVVAFVLSVCVVISPDIADQACPQTRELLPMAVPSMLTD